MNKKVLALVCCLMLMLTAVACQKKEEAPAPIVPQTGMPGQPGMGGQQGMPPGHDVIMPSGEFSVVVPDAVKGKWKGVVLVVEDKTSNKKDEFTVNLNSDLKIPNSDLKIAVGDFLPDFKMDGFTITSLSNDTNNPAVGVRVLEGENQIFPSTGKKWGWLYANFPSIHPFEHQKYSIMLKKGV